MEKVKNLIKSFYRRSYIFFYLFWKRYICDEFPIRFIMSFAPQKDGRIIIGVKTKKSNNEYSYDIPWSGDQMTTKMESSDFAQMTINSSIIVGYNTWRSLKDQNIKLKGRTLIVLSLSLRLTLSGENDNYGSVENPIFAGDINAAMYEAIKRTKSDGIYLAGGRQCFELFKDKIDQYYLSFIRKDIKKNNDLIEVEGALKDIVFYVFNEFENRYFNYSVYSKWALNYCADENFTITSSKKISEKEFLVILSSKKKWL